MSENLVVKKPKFTRKQEMFIDEYVRTGDITLSAQTCNLNKNTCSAYLKKPEIMAEINSRIEQAKVEGIATGTDAMLFLTQVMNGEIKDQFGLDATLRDRLTACTEILKRTKDLEIKAKELEKKADNEFHLSIDWTKNNDITTSNTDVNEVIIENEQEE